MNSVYDDTLICRTCGTGVPCDWAYRCQDCKVTVCRNCVCPTLRGVVQNVAFICTKCAIKGIAGGKTTSKI